MSKKKFVPARWIAVDFDDTLFKNDWPGIGKPITKNIKKLRKAREAGFEIIIHTSRQWSCYQAIEKALIKNSVPFDHIVCGKLYACAYVDDKSIPARSKSWIPKEVRV